MAHNGATEGKSEASDGGRTAPSRTTAGAAETGCRCDCGAATSKTGLGRTDGDDSIWSATERRIKLSKIECSEPSTSTAASSWRQRQGYGGSKSTLSTSSAVGGDPSRALAHCEIRGSSTLRNSHRQTVTGKSTSAATQLCQVNSAMLQLCLSHLASMVFFLEPLHGLSLPLASPASSLSISASKCCQLQLLGCARDSRCR